MSTDTDKAESELPAAPNHPVQSEMPFAVVEGEPVTALPVDLYIPPQALEVFLEAFEGPLDLLLYLIKRQNLDVLDIPIAEITRQYMHYIDMMQNLQLELAGEYLVMAAMLAEIKSRMLLPRQPAEDGDDEEDPRAELVRRLQEYERYKQAAQNIETLPRLERDTVVVEAHVTERRVVLKPPEVDLKEVLLAFRDVMQRAEMFAHHHVQRETLSVRQRMTDMLSTLQRAEYREFTTLFTPEEGRIGVVVTFIAMLELIRESLIEIVQAESFGPIHVRAITVERDDVIEGESAAAEDARDNSDEDDVARIAATTDEETDG
ncbi:MAG: segregation/condensation protein A [Gammaproteobacteria bacterium]|nr:segregation/condensation protein A [Gammaproteobacteria bacterium]NND60283.1 segregation/condensation protein A [Gammaproteobacteria bacterium]